jgi:lipopolysaccharide/colanic/teichoic acid biosynthesis glycosyltransferase
MGKRIFDILFSVIGLLFVGWIIFLFFILATIDTKQNGFFIQKRIGRHGKKFTIYKLRTIKSDRSGKPMISFLGNFLRKSKIDEFPQLYNVLINDMSFVGPRPDIEGYYDKLEGEDRKLLELKPGITGPASLIYRNEYSLLLKYENPKEYNDKVIFPDKIKLNLEYYYNHSFFGDIVIIIKTVLGIKGSAL